MLTWTHVFPGFPPWTWLNLFNSTAKDFCPKNNRIVLNMNRFSCKLNKKNWEGTGVNPTLNLVKKKKNTQLEFLKYITQI